MIRSLWLVPLIIAANVVAYTAAHLADPSAAIRNAERDLEDELHRQVADQIRQNKAQIAQDVSLVAAQHKAEEMLAQFASKQKANTGNRVASILSGFLHTGNDKEQVDLAAAEGDTPPQVRPKSRKS